VQVLKQQGSDVSSEREVFKTLRAHRDQW